MDTATADRALALTTKLARTRANLRLLYGARYDETVEPFRALIAATALAQGRAPLEVAVEMAQVAGQTHDPLAILCCLAAGADLAEAR